MSTFIPTLFAKPSLFFAIGVYLFLMIGIGFWSRITRKTRSKGNTTSAFMVEYFLAGRGMGGLTLAMSIITTYTSASSFIGGPGMAYSLGLGWVLLAMIQVPTTFLTLGIMGRKLAAFSRATGALTISDFIRIRYASPFLTVITSLCMIIFFIAVMLAQFIGGARMLEAITGAPYAVGLAFFGITVTMYTALGGFRAVVITDLFQGFIMFFAATAILFAVIYACGGFENAMITLASIDKGLVRPTGPDNAISIPFMLSFWVLVGFGVLGLPQTAQKCMAFKDDASLISAMLIGTLIIGFTLLCTHLTGALGRAIMPDLSVGDLIMPKLIVTFMPPFLAGIFVAGVLSAIMSTVSSMLIMTSATLIRDIYIRGKLKGNEQNASEQVIKKASIGITFLLGFVVFFLAITPPDLLVWVNLFAFGGLEAVFLWPMVLGLYWEKANKYGAICSVFTGVFVFTLLSSIKLSMMGTHPIVPSLFISGIAFWLGNYVDKIKFIKIFYPQRQKNIYHLIK